MQKQSTIFYTDDDGDDLSLFQLAGEATSANIYIFEIAEEMLTALRNPPPVPTIIFVDLNMPGKDGYEVIAEIRSEARYNEIPVVVLSTAGNLNIVNKSRDIGANYYIEKPTSVAKLESVIKHTLEIDWSTFQPTAGQFVHQF